MPALLIELLPLIMQVGGDVANLIQQHNAGEPVTEDQINALKAKLTSLATQSEQLNAQWASLAPKS